MAKQPRLYTIGSSPLKHADRLDLVVGIKGERPDPNSAPWFGLASAFLLELPAAEAQRKLECPVRVALQKSTFVLPKADAVNAFMVCNGTGIAPFRAFLQHKEAELAHSPASRLGKMTLLFGCRHRDEDYIFGDELEVFGSQNTLTALFEAFSRDEVGL